MNVILLPDQKTLSLESVDDVEPEDCGDICYQVVIDPWVVLIDYGKRGWTVWAYWNGESGGCPPLRESNPHPRGSGQSLWWAINHPCSDETDPMETAEVVLDGALGLRVDLAPIPGWAGRTLLVPITGPV